MEAVPASASQPRRRDARRNRERLLHAAAAVLGEQGVDASVDAIVAHAGVGVGTLYRHFPTREALVAALLEQRVGEVAQAVAAAAAEEDAANAVRQLVERLVELARRDPVLKELALRYPASADGLAQRLAETRARTEALLERARRHGALRADFTLADLVLLLWSLGAVADATAEGAPAAWRRQLGFALDGLRPGAASAALEPPLTDAQLAQAAERRRARRFERFAAQPQEAAG